MIGILITLSDHEILKGMMILVIIQMYHYLVMTYQPNQVKEVNSLEILSISTQIMSISIMLSTINSPYIVFVYIFLGIVVGINILFVMKLSKTLVVNYI